MNVPVTATAYASVAITIPRIVIAQRNPFQLWQMQITTICLTISTIGTEQIRRFGIPPFFQFVNVPDQTNVSVGNCSPYLI